MPAASFIPKAGPAQGLGGGVCVLVYSEAGSSAWRVTTLLSMPHNWKRPKKKWKLLEWHKMTSACPFLLLTWVLLPSRSKQQCWDLCLSME